jgi:hypothetical protein
VEELGFPPALDGRLVVEVERGDQHTLVELTKHSITERGVHLALEVVTS